MATEGTHTGTQGLWASCGPYRLTWETQTERVFSYGGTWAYYRRPEASMLVSLSLPNMEGEQFFPKEMQL